MNDDLDPKPLPPAEEQRLSAFLQADAAAGLDPRGGAEVAPEAAARREAIRRGFVSGGLESSLPASGGEAHRASTTEIRGGTISLDSLLPRRTRRVWGEGIEVKAKRSSGRGPDSRSAGSSCGRAEELAVMLEQLRLGPRTIAAAPDESEPRRIGDFRRSAWR